MRTGIPPKMKTMREGAEPAFEGVSEEQYKSYSPRQRYFLAKWNNVSLQELDKQFGVSTDIPDMEAFEKDMEELSSSIFKTIMSASKEVRTTLDQFSKENNEK